MIRPAARGPAFRPAPRSPRSRSWRRRWSNGAWRTACCSPGSSPTRATAATRGCARCCTANTCATYWPSRWTCRWSRRRESGPGTKAIKRADDLLPYAKRRDQWERRSCGHGTKGERYYDWTLFAVAVKGEEPASGFEHHVLIRRSTHKKQLAGGRFDFEYAYFLVHAPVGTTLTEAVAQAGIRWQVEEDNEQGKQLTGLDQYQVRKWMPWHRWITCVMLAHAFLAAQRADHLARLSESTGPNPSCEHTTADDAPCGPDATESDRPTRAAGAMIRLTVTALAGLLALTGLAVHPSDDQILARHHWRAEHQTTAAISHYQRRGDPLPPHLRAHAQNPSQKEDPLL